MNAMTTFDIAAVALLVGTVACITDLRTRRIPNYLTFGAAGVALIYHAFAGGWNGALMAGGGWVVGTLCFLPFFLLGGMGAGDVKLLAALGAWMGPAAAFWIAIYSSIAGGALGIGVAIARGYTRVAFRNVLNLVWHWCLVGPRPLPELTLERSSAPRLAYAIPVFVGTVVTLWLQ